MSFTGDKKDMEAIATPTVAVAGSTEHIVDTKKIDQAALFLAQADGYERLTEQQEQRLKRKIDWIMIPMLFTTATLGAVDKVVCKP